MGLPVRRLARLDCRFAGMERAVTTSELVTAGCDRRTEEWAANPLPR